MPYLAIHSNISYGHFNDGRIKQQVSKQSKGN